MVWRSTGPSRHLTTAAGKQDGHGHDGQVNNRKLVSVLAVVRELENFII